MFWISFDLRQDMLTFYCKKTQYNHQCRLLIRSTSCSGHHCCKKSAH